MKKLAWYEEIKKFIKGKEKNVEVKREFDSVHGFQLNYSDLGEYLSNFLDKKQADMLLNNLNSNGFLSYEIGIELKSLLEDSNFDTYIKSVHDSQIESIFNEGVRCYGTSSSLPTLTPNSIEKVRLVNTITKITDFPILISNIKGNNGMSQGFNMVNGTLIIQFPKNVSKEELLYFNENSHTYNIKPRYIVGFLPVDENQNVKEWIFPDQYINKSHHNNK